MLKKLKIFMFLLLITQNVFCMRGIIEESLDYYRYGSSANVQPENWEWFESCPGFLKNFCDEIFRWEEVPLEDVALEVIPLSNRLSESFPKKLSDSNSILNAFEEVKAIRHVAFARLITVEKIDLPNGQEGIHYDIYPLHHIFASGSEKRNNGYLANNWLQSMIISTDEFGFSCSSCLCHFHSERAILLALSNYSERPIFEVINQNTIDICLQIRNKSKMCNNCMNFLIGKSGFINRRFVGQEYASDPNYKNISTLGLPPRMLVIVGMIDEDDSEFLELHTP